jgi:hypothetical protein
LANSSRDYRTVAKEVNGNVEIWYAPVEWSREYVLPIAYQAVPKEWIAFQDIEAFIAPIQDLRPGIGHLEILFGRNLSGCRRRNPENRDGFVTVCADSNFPIPDIQRTLLEWKNPKQPQEQFNRRLYEISSLVEPAQAKFPSFLGQFTTEEHLW